ncbi:MAG: sugar phosphate isomerase/epimerase family protein [Tepidisphaerales bacterium]
MELLGHRIGVCSWSLRTVTVRELVAVVKAIGLSDVQLALAPLVPLSPADRKAVLDELRDAGIGILSGMISFPGEDYTTIDTIHRTGGYVPSATFAERRELTRRAAELAASANIRLVTTHVGFIPAPTDAGYGESMARIRQIADDLRGFGLTLGLETGQEPADRLLLFLRSLGAGNVVINFDPANMLLYGAGDPIAAVGLLGRHIGQVHLKDAVASARPGVEWGEEVPFGSGQVDAPRFLSALRATGYKGALVFEREAGADRVADLRAGIDALKRALGA